MTVFAYTRRRSSKNDVAQQQAKIHEYVAEAFPGQSVEMRDEGVCQMPMSRRPVARRLFNDAVRGDAIVITNLTTLASSQEEILELLDRCENDGIVVHFLEGCADGPANTGDPLVIGGIRELFRLYDFATSGTDDRMN